MYIIQYLLLLLYYLCEIYVCTGHFNKQLLTYLMQDVGLNVGVMLRQRCRRWANIRPTSGQRLEH